MKNEEHYAPAFQQPSTPRPTSFEELSKEQLVKMLYVFRDLLVESDQEDDDAYSDILHYVRNQLEAFNAGPEIDTLPARAYE